MIQPITFWVIRITKERRVGIQVKLARAPSSKPPKPCADQHTKVKTQQFENNHDNEKNSKMTQNQLLILISLFSSVLHCFEYKVTTLTSILPQSSSPNSCRFAQLKCSYRTGCGATLQSFLIECDALIHNRTNVCSNRCKNTLVGLTSTVEGQNLMSVSHILLNIRIRRNKFLNRLLEDIVTS